MPADPMTIFDSVALKVCWSEEQTAKKVGSEEHLK